MLYYNPETNEQIHISDLCKKFNASIPPTVMSYNGWYRLATGKMPDVNYYSDIKEGPVELIDGTYTVTYYAEEIDIDLHKQRKLEELAEMMEKYQKNAYLESSLGFKIDAGETANRDIQGLVTVMEATGLESVSFCDYENEFHELSLADVKTMQIEVIQAAQSAYVKKWQYRTAIEQATTNEELANINIEL